jgi:hypothetical protein
MMVELVAFSAPVPFLTQGLNFNAAECPCSSAWVGVLSERLENEKTMAKKDQF